MTKREIPLWKDVLLGLLFIALFWGSAVLMWVIFGGPFDV